jgi:hypothetical protein
MYSVPLDQQLRQRLTDISEIGAAGFSVRQGLTGAGVTVLKDRSYFGSWRLTAGALTWISATSGDGNFRATTVDDAIRHTMLLILQSLQQSNPARSDRAMAG